MNKKGFEFSFAWLFGLIVGAVILFLALYAASQFIFTSEKEVTAKTAVELANVLDPLKTTIESGSGGVVTISVETRIKTECDVDDDFGHSIISVSEQIGFGDKWTKFGNKKSVENSYLFAEEVITVEEREIHFFTFPFKMPFKVADVSVAYTRPYCFVSPPEDVKDTLEALTSITNPNIVWPDDIDACPDNTIIVCFDNNNRDCEVEVRCDNPFCTTGSVIKDGGKVEFINNIPKEDRESSLLYGAIFASKENYECNVERLMMRLSNLNEIYAQKAQFVTGRGCNTGLNSDIAILKGISDGYQDSNDLNEIELFAQVIEDKNDLLECHLY